MVDLTQTPLSGIWLGHELARLTSATLERELRLANLYDRRQKWADVARARGVFFDLSQAEWVDRYALVRVVLLAQHAARSGVRFSIALPGAREPLPDSNEDPHHAATRTKVADFLRYMRFEHVLATAPDAAPATIWMVRSYDPSTVRYDRSSHVVSIGTARVEAPEPLEQRAERKYKFDFPLIWLPDVNGTADLTKFLARVIAESHKDSNSRSMTIPSEAAGAVANVVLHELVENVGQHGQDTKTALVAAWVRGYRFAIDDYSATEAEYLGWLNDKTKYAIEVVIGDSGAGIVKTLRPAYEKQTPKAVFADGRADISAWAFERWSTSKPEDAHLRGTRGLYRLNRVVRKRQGLMTVRTDRVMIGFDYGRNRDRLFEADDHFAFTPGTAYHIVLPLLDQIDLATHRLVKSRAKEERVSAAAPTIHFVRAGALMPEGLAEWARARIVRVLQAASENTHVVVVIEPSEYDATPVKQSVEALLKWAASVRHPAGMSILGIPGGKEVIENAIHSVNIEHTERKFGLEHRDESGNEVWDPVFVFDAAEAIGWVGVPEEAALTFRDAATTGTAIEVEGEGGNGIDTNVREIIRNDPGTFVVESEGTRVRARVSRETIFDAAVEQFRAAVAEKRVYWTDGNYGTPSLLTVRRWLDVRVLLEDAFAGGVDAIVAALGHVMSGHPAWRQGVQRWIVSDSAAPSRAAESLASAVQAERFALIPHEKGYSSILEQTIPRGPVIALYCDVISSAESLHLMTRELRRAGLEPTLIATLVDARPERLRRAMTETLGIPVLSLVETDIVAAADEPPRRYIDPVTRGVEVTRAADDEGENAIATLVRDRNALHFTHAGEPAGRHFTFYLDAKELLDEPSITETMAMAVTRWMTEQNIDPDHVEIWHPAPEPKRAQPARRLAEELRRTIGVRTPVTAIRRQRSGSTWTFPLTYAGLPRPFVVIVDWGALAGTSISQMIRLAATAGAERVLACTFLSQLAHDEEAFLCSLKSLEGHDRGPVSLLGQDPASRSVRDVGVQVSFVGRFSVSAYSPSDCPVCQRIADLAAIHVTSAWLTEYRADVLRRLRQRTREDVVGRTPSDYFDSPFDPRLVDAMLKARRRIVQAQTSTRSRYELTAWFRRIIDDNDVVNRSAVVTLLANEIHWLERPPLNLSACADVVANLAASVAADANVPLVARWSAASVVPYLPLTPFVTRLPDICEVNARSEVVIAGTLLSLWAVATRSPAPSAAEASHLSTALGDAAARLEALATPDARNACASLKARVDARITEVALEETDERRVWSQLQSVLRADEREHHSSSYKMSHVYMPHERRKLDPAAAAVRAGATLSEAAARHLDERTLKKIARARDNWIECAEFFDRELTPRLRKLLPILEGVECRRRLGRYASRLLSFCGSRELILDDPFSHLLHEAASDPTILIAPENWELFQKTSDWIFEGLLKRLDATRMSPLRRLIASTPADLGIGFDDALAELENDRTAPIVGAESRSRMSTSRVAVFCPAELLKELFHQVLSNAWKHRDRHPAAPEPAVEAAIVDAPDTVIVFLDSYNTMQKPVEERGVGLSELQSRLHAFGCKLVPEGGDSNRFRVQLKLRKAVADA